MNVLDIAGRIQLRFGDESSLDVQVLGPGDVMQWAAAFHDHIDLAGRERCVEEDVLRKKERKEGR